MTKTKGQQKREMFESVALQLISHPNFVPPRNSQEIKGFSASVRLIVDSLEDEFESMMEEVRFVEIKPDSMPSKKENEKMGVKLRESERPRAELNKLIMNPLSKKSYEEISRATQGLSQAQMDSIKRASHELKAMGLATNQSPDDFARSVANLCGGFMERYSNFNRTAEYLFNVPSSVRTPRIGIR